MRLAASASHLKNHETADLSRACPFFHDHIAEVAVRGKQFCEKNSEMWHCMWFAVRTGQLMSPDEWFADFLRKTTADPAAGTKVFLSKAQNGRILAGNHRISQRELWTRSSFINI